MMNRTRQSAELGKRTPSSRRNSLSPSQKKTHKPNESPAITPNKGRYVCGQCRKFEGPRRSVEEHCRVKHRLTGERLQGAVRLRAELGDLVAGPNQDQQPSPQRTSKRQRQIPIDDKPAAAEHGHTHAAATGGKKRRQESPAEQRSGGDVGVIDHRNAAIGETSFVTKLLREVGKNAPKEARPGSRPNLHDAVLSPPLVEEISSDGHTVGGSPQETPERTCGKCRKTFTRERQFTKHKCFADEPRKTPKPSPRVKREQPLVRQKAEDILVGVIVGEGGWVCETDADVEGKSEEDSEKQVPEILDTPDESLSKVQDHLAGIDSILHGTTSATVSTKDGSAGAEAVASEDKDKSRTVVDEDIGSASQRLLLGEPQHTEQTVVKLEVVDVSLDTLTSPSSSSTAPEAIRREAQHFGGKLPPVSTLLKPQGTPESTCEKCKRTFSRARQLIKHKCFAAMDEAKPSEPAKPSSSGKSPRRFGTPSDKFSKESETSAKPKHVSKESQQTVIQARTEEATEQAKSSESNDFSENKMAEEEKGPKPRIATCNRESRKKKKSNAKKKRSKKTAGATLTTVVTEFVGLTDTNAQSHVTVWKTSPTTAVPAPDVTPTVSHPPPIVVSPVTTESAGRDIPSSSVGAQSHVTGWKASSPTAVPAPDVALPVSCPPPIVASSTTTVSVGKDIPSSSVGARSHVNVSPAAAVPAFHTAPPVAHPPSEVETPTTTDSAGRDIPFSSVGARSDVTLWKTSPAATVPASIVAPSSIVETPTATDSAGRDIPSSGSAGRVASSSSNVAVRTDVRDLPLEDILQSLVEEENTGGTDAEDSEPFREDTLDSQKTFDDPNAFAGPSGSIQIVPEAVKVESMLATSGSQGQNEAHLADISGSPSALLARIDKMSSDVAGGVSARATPKTPKLGKYAKLAVKQEQLDVNDKAKIAESIVPQTAQIPLSANTPEKVQIGIQNGKSFCVCSFCGTMRLEPDHMKEHLIQHVPDYLPFQCKDCDFLSRKRGRITAHMKKAHQGYLQCEFCDYNTYEKDKLDRHYKYWNRDFSNSCKFCHKKIAVGTKEEHLRIVHGKSAGEIASINLTADAFTCRHCGERLKSRHARRDHEKRHEPHFICPLCPYTTNSESVYVNHGRKHRVILVCCQCSAKFHSSHALKEHQVQEHPGQDPDQLYEGSIARSIFVASVLDEASIPECDIIGLDMGMRVKEEERRMSQQSSGETAGRRPIALPVTVEEMKAMGFGVEYDCYIKNIAYRHLSMSTLSFMFARYGKRECTHCGFLLHSLGSWKIHVSSHEGKRGFACTECEYKCRHKFLLERHILIAHKKQDFACDLCQQRFPYREYVYLHKRKDHYGGKMKCTYCVEVPFETEIEKEMKKHIIEEHPEMTSKEIAQIIGRRVHFTGKDGILFVKCKYCQKGFNRAAFLRQHVQTVHMQKKTFHCDQCGYKSNTKARLRTHMAVHTEVRDITCDECGAGFKNKVYLYKHIRRSHKRYATERGAAYCKRTRLKNVISLLQKERQEGSSYERQEIIQKEKAKLLGHDSKGQPSVEGVGAPQPTQINVFQCGDCGQYFENIFTLKSHFMSVHGESPNIPLDFEAAVAASGGSGVGGAPKEQVNIALDALNQSGNPNLVEQLFQCAKCNRMFPDMKSVEHHVKDVHATDTFLISDEGDIPSQELDLAAEVINHLTRESGQSGAINMMQSIVSQSTLDALSIEAQNAATALTTLPDAVLEMSNQEAAGLVSMEGKSVEVQSMAQVSVEDNSEEVQSAAQEGYEEQQQAATVVERIDNSESGKPAVAVLPERGDEMEAAHLLQQMGIFQQFVTATTTANSSSEVTAIAEALSDTPSAVELPGRSETVVIPEHGEDSVTIMVIEEDEHKQ